MILLSAIFERTVTDRIQHIEKLISKADGGTPLEYDLWREGDGKQDLTLYLRRLVPIMECLISDKRFAGHQYLEFDLRERVCFDPPPLHRARPSMNAESLRRLRPGTVRLTPPPRPGHRARHSAAPLRRPGTMRRRVSPPPRGRARQSANTSPAECDLGRFNDQFQQARTAHSPASGPMPELESTDSR